MSVLTMVSKLDQVLCEIEAGVLLTRVDLTNCNLTEVPRQLFALKDTLEILNLGNNRIKTLPDDIGCFTKLRILFFGQNDFEYIPAHLGELKALKMVSFKSNKVKSIHDDAFNSTVNWLILSDNKIEGLPSSVCRLKGLRKLMLAGNHLTSLPEELQQCRELELIRISANRLPSLPSWLFRLPKLAWLAYSGNPLSSGSSVTSSSISTKSAVKNIDWSEIQLLEKLGEGASGVVHQAVFNNAAVAVKLFKGDTTSDGLPEYEMKASEAVGEHPNFIPVLGRLVNAPNSQMGLVLPLISTTEFKILGNPPSFDSITRDTFNANTTFSLNFIINCLRGIASASEHLHSRVSLMHGDLYAHNILINESGETPLLTDFGAASFKRSDDVSFSEEEVQCLEGIEVRAFGCLIDDLLTRLAEPAGNYGVVASLNALRSQCWSESLLSRPMFSDIVAFLSKVTV